MQFVIDHVQIVAPPDCALAGRAFYIDTLGLTEITRPASLGGHGLWLACGEHEIHIAEQREFVPAKKAHVAFRFPSVASLHAIAERLTSRGSTLTWDTRLEGITRFFASDPWGNRLEFLARS